MQLRRFGSHDITTAVDFFFVIVFLVFSVIWAWKEFIKTPPYVDADKYPIRGIDVSAHNGMMNLDAAKKDGIDFILIKATEGVTFQDENFRINYDKAKHAGMKIGFYHFFRFDRDGVQQALNLFRTIGNRRPDLGIVIDVEDAGNPKNIPRDSILERLSAMADYINIRGEKVIFYSNKEGYYKYIEPYFKAYPLWICSFSSNPINSEWIFWQYNHHGRVSGIRGDVDLNTFNGSREDFDLFCSPEEKQ